MRDRTKLFPFARGGLYIVIQENDDAYINPDSDALEPSTMAMASATVSRNVSYPRRPTIPAISNVFRGRARRCVINNPTPRLYEPCKC